MTEARAFFLGAVQGLGEFLPISSSGHLIVVPWLLGWPDSSLSFDVALHVGTLAAVIAAFAADWWRILRGAWGGLRAGTPFATAEGRLLILLVVASLPAGVAGLLLDDWAETTFRSPILVAGTLGIMGIVLAVADRRAAPGGETPAVPIVSVRDALLIGGAQALALLPGVSRSGATISMALFLGHRRNDAARFSFLLATPITVGASLMKVPHLLPAADGALYVGMASAALFGFLSIRVLLAYVRTRDYWPFVIYRLVAAAAVATVWVLRRG